MPAPAAPTAPAVAFNDGAIPFGSRAELFCSGGTTSPTYLGWYLCEQISPSRPSKVVERPNQIGGPNGFAMVAAQENMTVKAQLASQTSATIKRGDWFQDSFDPSNGTVVIGLPSTTPTTTETWVVETSSEKYEMNGYWYQDLNLKLAHNPPA